MLFKMTLLGDWRNTGAAEIQEMWSKERGHGAAKGFAEAIPACAYYTHPQMCIADQEGRLRTEAPTVLMAELNTNFTPQTEGQWT